MSKSTLALKTKHSATVAVNPDLQVRLVELQRQAQAAKPVSAPALARPPGPERAPWPLFEKYQVVKERLKVIGEYKPLAIGVKVALLEMATAGSLGLTPIELVDIMRVHSFSTGYLKALANDGAYRHDLEGNPVEPVSDDHRRYACELLLRRNEKRKLKQGERT